MDLFIINMDLLIHPMKPALKQAELAELYSFYNVMFFSFLNYLINAFKKYY